MVDMDEPRPAPGPLLPKYRPPPALGHGLQGESPLPTPLMPIAENPMEDQGPGGLYHYGRVLMPTSDNSRKS